MEKKINKIIIYLSILSLVIFSIFLFFALINTGIIFESIKLSNENIQIAKMDAAPGIGHFPHELTYGFWDMAFVWAIIIIEILVFIIIPMVIIVNFILAMIGLIIFSIIKKKRKTY